MSMRSIVLVLAIFTLTIAPALALEVDVNPRIIYIEPGGTNYTIVTIESYPLDWVEVWYKITEYSEYLDARLTELDGTPLTDWSDLNSTWIYTDENGLYQLILEFRATDDLPPNGSGETMAVAVNVMWDINGTTIDIYPIPELPTLALMALGLVGLAVLFVKRAE